MHMKGRLFIIVRRLACLMAYSPGKVKIHHKVKCFVDFVEYDGNYHKENEAAVYSEKYSFCIFC